MEELNRRFRGKDPGKGRGRQCWSGLKLFSGRLKSRQLVLRPRNGLGGRDSARQRAEGFILGLLLAEPEVSWPKKSSKS